MKIEICNWKSCQIRGAKYIKIRLENDKKFAKSLEKLGIDLTACMWNCQNSPNIKIEWEILEKQNPAKTSEIVFKKFNK